jgi:hypothetical protein
MIKVSALRLSLFVKNNSFLAGKLVRLQRSGTGRKELAILSGRRVNINIHLLPDIDGQIQTQIPASTVEGPHRRETKDKG